ncbi:hypothetical protein ALC62_13930 [Cyphomyrmex costatus]|uniref:Gustatory receptor n=1 Tax=Cyphomyrmex costatus TaxID=456900 RepID=A0A195C4G2_9HYME|nr:hypothetical protein ALC62_13930 [Cyphomyrmex costatus]
MITTIQQAVHPLFLICSVFGIGIYSPKIFYLNILYNLTVWISYGCLCYYVVTGLNAGIWFQSISNILFVWIGVLTSLIIVIMSIYQDKKFRLFMKRLTAIDDTLEELGIPKMYQKLHTCAKRVLIGWLMCSYALNTFDMMWWIHVIENHWCIIIPYITNHVHHVNMLMDLLLMTLLWCANEMKKIIHQLTDSFQHANIHDEFIFGFGIVRYPFNHPKVYLSILYILIKWSVYVYVFYYVVNIFSPKIIFSGSIKALILIINILVTIISVINTFRKSEKFRMCIKKLSFVDNTLELLGTPKEYHKIRNSMKWIFITWFTMICTTWFVDSLWYIEKHNDVRAMFIPIVKDYLLHINTLMDMMYMFLLRFVNFIFLNYLIIESFLISLFSPLPLPTYIGTRLDKINNHIKELSVIEEYGLRYTWKKPLVVTQLNIRSTENRKHILWITMHLHSELCRIAFDIHGLFNIHMTLQMISYFIILIAMFHFQYHTMFCLKQMYGGNLIRLKLLLCSDVWFIICLTKLISFNHICESVSVKAKKTKDMIHKLTNLICFTEAREEIVQFVLQISLRPLKFSGLGLFYFGYNFIHKTAISPLSVVLCLCGFGVFEYPQNQPRFCVTIFYILISWLSYVYIAFRMMVFLRKNDLTFTMLHYSNMVFAILYMLSNFYYNKKFKSCLNKLNIVSNTIEKLGISKNYAKLRIQTTWLITGWIILVILTDINDYVWYCEHIPKSHATMAICAPIGNHPIHINTLYDFMYIMLLRYIGFQFEHINKYIQELVEQKKVGHIWANSTSLLIRQHIVGTKTSKQNIWILM